MAAGGNLDLERVAADHSTTDESSEGEHVVGAPGVGPSRRLARGALAFVGLGALAVLLHACATGKAEELLARLSSKNFIAEQLVAVTMVGQTPAALAVKPAAAPVPAPSYVQVAGAWCDHGNHEFKTLVDAQEACNGIRDCSGVYSLRSDPRYGFALCSSKLALQQSDAKSSVYQKGGGAVIGTTSAAPGLTTLGEKELEKIVETFRIPKDQIATTDCKIAIFAMAKGMCAPGTGLRPTCISPKEGLDKACEQWYGGAVGVPPKVKQERIARCKETANRAAQAQDAVRVKAKSNEEENICLQCDIDACTETPTWILAQERAEPAPSLPKGVTYAPPDGGPNHCRPMLNGKVVGVQMRARKEILQWSDVEFAKFKKALNDLRNVKGGGLIEDLADYPNTYGSFVAAHPFGHHPKGVGPFLPWHRHHLLDLETQLQKIAGDCSITLPYWNSNLEAGNPLDSFVWDESRYGGQDGSWFSAGGTPCTMSSWPGRGYCLKDGIAANWTVAAPRDLPFCDFCVHRSPSEDTNLPSWPEIMDYLMKTLNLADVSARVEELHVPMHVNIAGGSMSNIMVSPRDPIFFLHHAYADRLFSWWQRYHTARGRDTSSAGFDATIMAHFKEPAGEWIGIHDLAQGCTMLPKTNPRVCLKYIGEMPVPEKEF